ncbi:MAG: flagellar biosynthesis regulator FlaF [Paracoccaceae bacterium]|nr:flagellar biosynthesis regulator FlaF [Paracoccaceae bacterium]
MNAQNLAHRAYAASAASTRTDRGTEYELIARISHRIRASAQSGPSAYPQLVAALSDNQKLWTTLAVDVADPDNGLPQDLRARIFFLAEFVQQHTGKVLAKKAKLGPLLEINASILRGLSAKRAQR